MSIIPISFVSDIYQILDAYLILFISINISIIPISFFFFVSGIYYFLDAYLILFFTQVFIGY